jgi:hypothetical protein
MEQIEHKLTGTSNVQKELDPRDSKMLENVLVESWQRITTALQTLANQNKDNISLVQSLTCLHDLSRKGLTLTHLASALDYSKLATRFQQWRMASASSTSLKNSSLFGWFDLQTDVAVKDLNGNTALVRF